MRTARRYHSQYSRPRLSDPFYKESTADIDSDDISNIRQTGWSGLLLQSVPLLTLLRGLQLTLALLSNQNANQSLHPQTICNTMDCDRITGGGQYASGRRGRYAAQPPIRSIRCYFSTGRQKRPKCPISGPLLSRQVANSQIILGELWENKREGRDALTHHMLCGQPSHSPGCTSMASVQWTTLDSINVGFSVFT